MYAVIKNYSCSSTTELFDLHEECKAEIESFIRFVVGLVTYSLIRTDNGGVTVTVCEDKVGTDEST